MPSDAGEPAGGLSEEPRLWLGGEPAAPALQEFLAAWRGWPKTGRVPRRSAFDPVQYPKLLPWMLLHEVDGHPNRYRDYDMLFRYIGSSIAETLQMENLTGKHLSDIGDPFAERWFPVFDQMKNEGVPVVVRGKPYLIDKAYVRFEIIYLPLARNEPADADEVGFDIACMHRELVPID